MTSSSSFVFRTKILFLFILLFGLVLIGKLFVVQIIQKSFYSDRADRQYATASSDIFERGSIYFTTKDDEEVFAATQASGFKVAIDPTKITDEDMVYTKLNSVVALDRAAFDAKANKKNDPYEEVADKLSKEQADAISAFGLTGVSIFKEKWRSYPGGSLAAQTIGFLGYKGDVLAGRYGLERQYDTLLSRNANNPYVNFFAEVFSNINEKLFKNNTAEGDIVTTIEPTVQHTLETELEGVKEKYNADSIGGIIMNPKDGSIYAMASLPDFDLNNFTKVQDPYLFSNPLVENVLEFGSVVKPLVMAGALDAGVVTPQTTYDDKGSVTVENKQIFNFDKVGRGPGTTMQEVLNQSLNTGMVFVEQHLGKEKFRDYMLSYGIKDKTGIDLPNETSGLVSNIITSPREIEYANAAFGQGIALTPIEMIRALASLANGGNLVTPHVVKEIKYTDGLSKTMTYPTTRVKITPASATEITGMLINVMDQSLKSGAAKFDHYSVAVKTGTAQVANNTTGGYYEDRHTHSFIGYFPAYDPQFIVFLYAVNPKGVAYASQTWADPFLSITKFLLNYYDVPPDR